MITGISFMGANLVAQHLDWNMTKGWAAAERATDGYYAPLDTFAKRFDAFLGDVAAIGFDWIDVWKPQVNGAWRPTSTWRSRGT